MSQRRKHYRAKPEAEVDIEVHLMGAGDRAHPARLVDAAGGGMRVALASDWPRGTELGKAFLVRLTSKALPVAIETPVKVVHAEWDDDVFMLGLRLLDWMGLAAVLPANLASLFNLRQDPRLCCDPTSPVPVTIRGFDGTFELAGVLYDLSRNGLSFSAPLASQADLGRSEAFQVEFSLPATERRFTFGARLRYRSLAGEVLRFGVWFDPERTEDFLFKRAAVAQYVDARLEAALRDLAPK